MEEKIKEYESESLTVLWKPSQCIHSKICWHGLGDVFRPQERPWVDVSGAQDERIKKQIDQCPSGALSYRLKNEANLSDSKEFEVSAKVVKGGPIKIEGKIEIEHANGSKEIREGVTALCRCGASSKKPFCDGSHREIEFE